MRYAKDFKCQVKGCNEQAVVFVGLNDLDAEDSFPYCRKHADEWKLKCLIEMQKIDEKYKPE